ncbi:MAG: polyhydroxybutyrate depolymerase [Mycobacteriaceae bacterium]|nr:polyhydroxybutyrate depolymerase [Mycobacteriaceae bacterium]
MTVRLIAVLAAVVGLAGCSWSPRGTAQPTTAFPDGSSLHTINVGGVDRSYRVHKPAGLPTAAPLVVMLHGGFGSGEQAERAYGWDQLADSEKFVVAYPDGVARAWNVHGCCGRPSRDDIDDVAFITATVDEISRGVGIDRSRIYATGISNGGMMSYTLACNSGVFAAIGPDSATQLDPCGSPHPTSVMHIHGTADRLIRYEGGRGEGVAHVDGPPVPDLNAFWRNVDQCGAPVVVADGPLTTSTADCAANRSVVLVTVDGGGHEWPSFATQKLWEFFAAHPR